MADVCVVGAGPAGAVFAFRMAALGHRVEILEASAFPRGRLGESLTPGVAPLLQSAGLGRALDGPHAKPTPAVEVAWESEARLREGASGFLVERGGFDAALLVDARAAGVAIRQPARARAWSRENGRWRVEIETPTGAETLRADLIADARGRGGAAPRTGARTIALYAYAQTPLKAPRIAALDDGWAWGVPLPGGLSNLLVFLDAHGPREEAARRWRARAAAAGFDAPLCDIRAIDATPYLDPDCAGADYLKLGDRAVALDPLSSSGVQKAIQNALSGAIVANTLLRKPERAEAAMRFHSSQLAATSARHAEWAGEHYAATGREGAFWAARARPASPEPAPLPIDRAFLMQAPLALSADAQWRETPCLSEAFVALAPALTHPGLPEPVAYLSGQPLAPLFEAFEGGRTALDIARGWTSHLPLEDGLGVAAWLAARGVLARQGALA